MGVAQDGAELHGLPRREAARLALRARGTLRTRRTGLPLRACGTRGSLGANLALRPCRARGTRLARRTGLSRCSRGAGLAGRSGRTRLALRTRRAFRPGRAHELRGVEAVDRVRIERERGRHHLLSRGDRPPRLLPGRPQRDPTRKILGNYNPDWVGGIQNRFGYGAFDLSVLVDGQYGGDIFSTTNWFGEYSGVLESSLRGRENDICDPGLVVPGVLPNGSVNGDGVDDVTVCPELYFHRNFSIDQSGIDEASYIKVREVRLGYRIPESFMSRLGFSGGDIALIGRNLFLWSKIDNIDPETAFDASNVQGIEFGQHPTARSLGFSVSIRP